MTTTNEWSTNMTDHDSDTASNDAEFRLDRTGDRPVAFSGRRLASIAGNTHVGREVNRWYDIDMYQTASGKFIANVRFETQWRGEPPHSEVFVADNATAVSDWLTGGFDPLSVLRGFPPGEKYAERQQALEADMLQLFEHRVSQLLSECGDLFVDRL